MKTAHARILEAVVADLFVNGFGEQADRLVLTQDGQPPRDLGGWGKQAVRNKVLRALLANEEAGR